MNEARRRWSSLHGTEEEKETNGWRFFGTEEMVPMYSPLLSAPPFCTNGCGMDLVQYRLLDWDVELQIFHACGMMILQRMSHFMPGILFYFGAHVAVHFQMQVPNLDGESIKILIYRLEVCNERPGYNASDSGTDDILIKK